MFLTEPLKKSSSKQEAYYINLPRLKFTGKAIVDNDLDATFPKGTQLWFKNSYLHRKGLFKQQPAVVKPDGTKEWWVNGKRHRKSRPAIKYPTGYVEYWENGKMKKRPTLTRKLTVEELEKTSDYLSSFLVDRDAEDTGSVSEFFEGDSGKEYNPNILQESAFIKFMLNFYPGRCFLLSSNQYYVKDLAKLNPAFANEKDELRFERSTTAEFYSPDMQIEVSVDDGSSSVPSLINTLRDPRTTISKSFVVVLGLNQLSFLVRTPFASAEGGGGHSNALFVDNFEKKIYVFEPNGSVVLEDKSWGLLNKSREAMINYVKEALSLYGYGNYTISFQDTCPRTGPQSIQTVATDQISRKFPTMLGDAAKLGGYCQAWSLMFMTYALINPYLTYEQIFNLITAQFSAGDLAKRIDQFSGFIAKVYKDPEAIKKRMVGFKRKSRRIISQGSECARLIKSLNEIAATPPNKGKTVYELMTPQQFSFFSTQCLLPENSKGIIIEDPVETEIMKKLRKMSRSPAPTSSRAKTIPKPAGPYPPRKPTPTATPTIEITPNFVLSANRKKLQAAAKENGIPANKSSEFIIQELLRKNGWVKNTSNGEWEKI